MSFQSWINNIPIKQARNAIKLIKDQLVTDYTAADAVVTAAFGAADTVVDNARKEVGQIAEVTLASADILASNKTPIEVIAAPGASKYIVIDDVFILNDFGTKAYAFGGTACLHYTDGSGDKVITDYPDDNTILEATADAVDWRPGIACVPVANAAIVFASATADPTTGDGDFELIVKYHIIDMS